MTIITQLTLTGKEAEDYLAYRVSLKHSGCNTFEEWVNKNTIGIVDRKHMEMLKMINRAIFARIIADGAHIVGGTQINSSERHLEYFKEALEAYLTDYIEERKTNFKYQADKLFDFYTK